MSLLIADASPLIGLARASSLHLLRDLYHNVVIPQVVFNELETSSNKPGAVILAKAIESDWLSVQPITGELPTTLLKTVDRGEAEAIHLACCRNAENPILLIDERKGRIVAKNHGVKIIGTGGILLQAKQHGYISAIAPVLEELSSAGYRLSKSLHDGLIALAGEE